VINRSESQLIAREQLNQVMKTSRQAGDRSPVGDRKPVRAGMPKRKTRAS
jgi:hypothetical protein